MNCGPSGATRSCPPSEGAASSQAERLKKAGRHRAQGLSERMLEAA